MKKLLVIAPSFFPNIGGVEKHLASVLPLITDKGYKITVLVRYKPQLPKKQTIGKLNIYRLPKEGKKSLWLNTWLRLHRHLWMHSDVVHSHDYFIPFLRKRLQCKWIHTYHGFEAYPPPTVAVKSRQLLNNIVDYKFAVGRFIEKWYGTPCDEIIWGASDMRSSDKKRPHGKSVSYLFLGRLESDTGVLDYVDAFVRLAQHHNSLSLKIVGNGLLKDEIEHRLRKANLQGRYTIADATAKPETEYAKCDVALVSGYLAIIEAGRFKLPVVSTYNNPLKKDYLTMHPCAKGLYIAKKGSDLSRAMELALSDHERRADMLHAWSVRQTWNLIADKYISAYEVRL